MALALSPQQQVRPVIAPMRPSPTAAGLKLSVDCRTRRNQQVQARYRAEARARQRVVYRRRRIAAVCVLITIAAVVCLGVRVMASRGDGTASLPTVTPARSAVVFAGADGDVSGAFVRGDQVYIVQPGDTLWSIASSLTDGNIRTFVSDLIDLNGSASIDVGQRLLLPAG